MPRVEQIEYIKGTDRTFELEVIREATGEGKDLSAFVGQTGDILNLKMQGDSGEIMLTLDDSPEGKLEVLNATKGALGKIQVTLKDTATLMEGDKQDMILTIKEGPGPDFEISCVIYRKVLYVQEKLFS